MAPRKASRSKVPAKPAGRIILVLGGASSGKSQVALDLARGLAQGTDALLLGVCPSSAGDRHRLRRSQSPVPVPVRSRRGQTPRADVGKGVSPRLAFVATGEALDREMAQRIERHQASRSRDWHTSEVPCELVRWFSQHGRKYQAIVLDCLTLWLSNVRRSRVSESAIHERVSTLLEAIRKSSARVVIVSNELGLGLVPVGQAVRKFRDVAGKVNQQVAAEADEVHFVISGQSLRLK